ncbi:MAG: ASCH domain-containing protein [Roseburia sp.]|nr:ASCH domain-containing protein [Roseburia sp.]
MVHLGDITKIDGRTEERKRGRDMKPILFNTEMVQAILEGRKTVTRRVVKPQPKDNNAFIYKHTDCGEWFISPDDDNDPEIKVKPPYCPGDILYVRETWCPQYSVEYPFVYRASVETPKAWAWRPSIHMPKEAARLFLRVKDVRVEKLQDILIEDVYKEGWPEYLAPTDGELRKMMEEFVALWNSTIKPTDLALCGWDADPWVWVIEFEKVSKEEALQCST